MRDLACSSALRDGEWAESVVYRTLASRLCEEEEDVGDC